MAARRRTVDAELFAHAAFRRASYVQREVWVALIVSECDDEGRFKVDHLCLLESIFSRTHDATEADIAEALDYWQQRGWIVLYEDGKVGHLTGWYEHQFIERPEPSTLPTPPVLVSSWEAARRIKRWWAAHSEGRMNVHFRTALRAFSAACATDSTLSSHILSTECPQSSDLVAPEREGNRKGKEEEERPSPDLTPEQRCQGLLNELAQADRDLVVGYLDNCADENSSKRITSGRRLSEVVALVGLRLELMAQDPTGGVERWRYGLQQSNAHHAPNINYVKKAALNWRGSGGPGQAVTGRGRSVSEPAPDSVWEKIAEEQQGAQS